jgi:hypothetical protein
VVCVTRALSWRIHANSVGVRLAIDTGAVTVGPVFFHFALRYCQRVPSAGEDA